MTLKKKISFGFLLLLIVLGIVFFDLIRYGIRQGQGQWHIISNAKPVEEYLSDPSVSQEIKNKLFLIDTVRKFAVEELQLTNTENYTEMFDQQGEPVLWVVTGCEPYQFIPYQWYFPVVGSVPYKGFFKKELAEEEAKVLKEKGLDVNIRTVGGWSTLGWFKDPILSEMLTRGDGDLVNLIIHELVHATIFVKDSVTFNENLASFIADKGTLRYLSDKYRSDSSSYIQYTQKQADQKAYIAHVLRGSNQLDSLYKAIVQFDSEQKEVLKTTMINRVMNSMDTISLNDSLYLNNVKDYQPNNAYFMSFQRYQSKQELLDSLYVHQFHKNLINFIQFLKEKHGAD